MDQSVVNGSSRIQLCLELAPIGGQLFAHDNSQRDCTAFRLPIVTYATRLLAQPLRSSHQKSQISVPCIFGDP